MNRYLEVGDDVVEVFLSVLEERFPQLIQLKTKLIFDTKRRIKQGAIVLASVELATEKLKFFSKDNMAVDGYDVVITIDAKTWDLASTADRVRVMSHELRHIFIDENGNPKIIQHDVSDFRAEQKLNIDDPDWSLKLSTLVNDVYEQEKEMTKKPKSNREN